MQNNSQKRGIALGAVIALASSLLVGGLPAQASTAVDGAKLALTPVSGSVSNFNGTILEDFPLMSYLLPGASNSNFVAEKVRVEITRVSGNVDILVATSSAIADGTVPASFSPTTNNITPSGSGVPCDDTCSTLSQVVRANQTTASQFVVKGLSADAVRINIRAFSSSATAASFSLLTAVVDVKVFIENNATNDGVHGELEDFVTKRITLHGVSAIPVTAASITAMEPGDSVVTVSATVGALNFHNLSGVFSLQMLSVGDVFSSSPKTSTVSADLSNLVMTSRSGVVSASFAVTGSTGVGIAESISGRVMYAVAGSWSTKIALGTTFSMVVANPGVTQLFADVVASDNATQSGTTATVRTNTTTTFKIGAKTNSASVSGEVNVQLSGGSTLTQGVKEIRINGATATTSYPTRTNPLKVTTGADGFATFTVQTLGFVGGEAFTVVAFINNVSKSLTVNVAAATHSLTPVYSTYQSAAGEKSTITWTITDQWDVDNTRTDFRLKVTRGGDGFNYAETVSYVAVTGGVASFDFTPAPATKTGSARVDATLQVLNPNTGGYVETGIASTQIEINVSAAANAFGTGLAVSRAASVSYFPDTVSWAAVSGKVVNTGSLVVATGTGLVFEDNAGKTYSGRVEVRATGVNYSFRVAGTKAGTATITLTNGSATTTSLLVVAAAESDMGRTITWDTTAIDAGKTRVITGTLTDANGNPVDTTGIGRTAGDSGTASILVTYQGTAGIVVGTVPTETDADGKFRISVLTSVTDTGTLTLTAVYMPQGASTVAANKVTSVQAVTVAPASAPEVNAVIGSFLGRWAVRVENAKGAVVSVKVGGNWFKYTSLNDNYLFSRKSRVGATIAVSVWVNGELQNSQTITVR